MAITAVKLHPAIGITRLGIARTSFVSPERLWDPPDPAGSLTDSNCRVKRQAARFQLYAFHDDGSIDEITTDEAEISWTVHLVNKKAVKRNPSAPVADMTIDPGARTLSGPDQRDDFDTGKITFPAPRR